MLAANLSDAQDRIARLEAATYTPPASPVKAVRQYSHENDVLEAFDQSPSRSKCGQQGTSPTESEDYESRRGCYFSERPCDLQRHLQPIQDGIATLTTHLLRVESCLTGGTKTESSGHTSESYHSCVAHTAERDENAEPDATESSPTKQSPRRRKDVRDQRTQLERSVNVVPRHVFGQPSTPITRRLSLSSCSSAFTNYADERSPFAQLSSRKQGQTSIFSLLL